MSYGNSKDDEMSAKPLPAGTKRRHPTGYINVKVIDHPEFGTGWVKEHHLVLFEEKGIRIKKGGDKDRSALVVHHKNGDKADNRSENLELMTKSEHDRMNMIEKNERNGGPWNKGKKGVYSEEHRAKLADANRRRVWKEESKAALSEKQKQNSLSRKRNSKGQYQ